MVDTRHDLSITVYELEAIENDDFHENVKYLISQKLLDIRYVKSKDFCELSVKKW